MADQAGGDNVPISSPQPGRCSSRATISEDAVTKLIARVLSDHRELGASLAHLKGSKHEASTPTIPTSDLVTLIARVMIEEDLIQRLSDVYDRAMLVKDADLTLVRQAGGLVLAAVYQRRRTDLEGAGVSHALFTVVSVAAFRLWFHEQATNLRQAVVPKQEDIGPVMEGAESWLLRLPSKALAQEMFYSLIRFVGGEEVWSSATWNARLEKTRAKLGREFGIRVTVDELRSIAYEDMLELAGPATLKRKYADEERRPRTIRQILSWGHLKHPVKEARGKEEGIDDPDEMEGKTNRDLNAATEEVGRILAGITNPTDNAILRAMYELLQEGVDKPTDVRIAQKTGYNVGTVRRHLKPLIQRLRAKRSRE